MLKSPTSLDRDLLVLYRRRREYEPGEIHAAAEPVEAAADEDETVDLEAVLGGNIRKAPAASEPDAEPESLSAQAAV